MTTDSQPAIEGTSLLFLPDAFPDPVVDVPLATPGSPRAVAVLAGGCFWCTEAVYRHLEGVLDVTPGYAGGVRDTADYASVSSGKTDHAEAIRIGYDPARITFGQLLKVFFSIAHDPTQRDRQGHDIGRQYRSAIFPQDDAQQRVAAAYVRQLDAVPAFNAPIVTTIEPGAEFFEAEPRHHDYARRNPTQRYIAAVAAPKVRKLETYFPDRTRKDEQRGAP